MGDTYIVTDRKPFRHDTLDAAQKEAARLRGLHPEKNFTVLRCKWRLERTNSYPAMRDALEAAEPYLSLLPADVASKVTDALARMRAPRAAAPAKASESV